MGAGDRGHRPGEAPAVAVEHRQRPQVDRVARQVPRHHVGDRVHVGAAVVDDDPLRVAGRARGVVQADRVPLVRGMHVGALRVALVQEVLVADVADRLARAVVLRIVDVDHVGPARALGDEHVERLSHHRRELAVDDQHLRVGVLQDERDHRRVQPRVDAVEHRARHRHAVVRLDHLRRVRQHDRHRVAFTDLHRLERARQRPRPFVDLPPAAAQRTVDHRASLRVDVGGPLDEAHRRERHEVRRVAVETLAVGVRMGRHVRFLVGGYGTRRTRPAAVPRRPIVGNATGTWNPITPTTRGRPACPESLLLSPSRARPASSSRALSDRPPAGLPPAR